MRLLFTVAAISLLFFSGVAEAQHRRDHRHGVRNHAPHVRHYAPPVRHNHRQHRNRNNYAPWIAGVVGLGILGALTHDQWSRPVSCYRVFAGYDYYGNRMFQRVCE